jgi:predicted secreted hydrolase
VRFEPLRRWKSPSSQASYPVEWQVETPAGRFKIKALLDEQELDSRGSTGTIYWEGVSDLLDEKGQAVGRGYLEMTGYAGKLNL